MKICDYSSLIFAGNTTVLLIVSLSTDYWEFRSFNKDDLLQIAKGTEGCKIVLPTDTDSYFQIIITERRTNCTDDMVNSSMYQAPLFVVQYFCPDDNMSTTNVTHHVLSFFQQYGNLFRDCDNLEYAVRLRLGISKMRPKKCTYFHNQWSSSMTHYNAPELDELEALSCACAMVCIVCVTIGAALGAHGLFDRYNNGHIFYVASISALLAGFSLTLAIALFHGRCQILRNMVLFPNHSFQLKDELSKLRTQSFGWSFILAWICVIFCYISSYVWLAKAQESSRRYKSYGLTGRVLMQNEVHRLHSTVFVNYMNFRNVIDHKDLIATL